VKNHMKTPNTFEGKLLKWIVIAVLAMDCSAGAADGEAEGVVYHLYKDFGWMALFASADEGSRYLGKPITDQPRNVLRKYFNAELTQLLLNEASCNAKSKGELCNLEFDPIFASQDTAATNLTIKSIIDGEVMVQFIYPSNNQKIKLEYKLNKSEGSWKISDIIYFNNDQVSLKSILRKK
jgi:hypothetical protein